MSQTPQDLAVLAGVKRRTCGPCSHSFQGVGYAPVTVQSPGLWLSILPGIDSTRGDGAGSIARCDPHSSKSARDS